MKLQILVPQYNENDDVIMPLLDSIALQVGIDFNDIGVIIVNDGSDIRISEDLLNYYNSIFEVKYHINEHKGVSATRNKCLDLATADYVMFCDADDMFYNVCGIKIILDEIEKSHFDTMSSAFIEEQHLPNGEIKFLMRENDCTFVHGKVHRRQYLIDQNIRWNEKLKIHEDSFFNCLCRNLTQNAVYAKTPFYLWKYRADSVCRKDPDYLLKTYVNMIDSNDEMLQEFISRNLPSLSEFYATSFIYQTYCLLNKKEWLLPQNKCYVEQVNKRFALWYSKYKDLYRNVEEGVMLSAFRDVRMSYFNQGLIVEKFTLDNWLKAIDKMSKDLQ